MSLLYHCLNQIGRINCSENLEESGTYSVKSVYRLLQTQKGAWNTEKNDRIWQQLWGIKAPPKNLNLVWTLESTDRLSTYIVSTPT